MLALAAGLSPASGGVTRPAGLHLDFDGDGWADLAVDVTMEHIGSIAYAGVVHVLYGSGGGLAAAGNQLWYQGYLGVEGVAEAGDRFGWTLAAIPAVRYQVYLPLVVRDW